jgi:hypothetical protein
MRTARTVCRPSYWLIASTPNSTVIGANEASSAVEGINYKAWVITRRAYGLTSGDSLWTRLIRKRPANSTAGSARRSKGATPSMPRGRWMTQAPGPRGRPAALTIRRTEVRPIPNRMAIWAWLTRSAWSRRTSAG